jgi:hypothetical protein
MECCEQHTSEYKEASEIFFSPNSRGNWKEKELRCLSPQANYPDRATAACRRS